MTIVKIYTTVNSSGKLITYQEYNLLRLAYTTENFTLENRTRAVTDG